LHSCLHLKEKTEPWTLHQKLNQRRYSQSLFSLAIRTVTVYHRRLCLEPVLLCSRCWRAELIHLVG
jgi:hypothetical protein